MQWYIKEEIQKQGKVIKRIREASRQWPEVSDFVARFCTLLE